MQALLEYGRTPGDNVRIEIRRGSGDSGTLSAQAAELISSGSNVIVAIGNPAVVALRRETSTIPIVFVQVGDPVGSGFVSSLARPGRNVTGFMHFEPAMGGKWLELLKEMAPTATRVLVLMLPEVAANVEFVRAAEAAGPSYKVVVSSAGVHNAREIEQAVKAFGGEANGGLMVLPNPVTGNNHSLLAQLAIRHALPSIAAFNYMAVSGLLASYGIGVPDLYRRAAGYVGRILRGNNPAEMPVLAPTKYELAINLITAKALGLTIPPSLLARADEVIE